MATHTTLTSLFTDIADSIREKTGDTADIVADNFPTAIANIPSGGGEIQIPEHGVFFMDYDGTYVETWETSTVASKTALPANPAHTGLVAQGWNWTLNDIKSYIQDYPKANVYVGQMYATTSGLTEFDIVLTKRAGLSVTLNMSGSKNWGDGTEDNLTTHTYENYGNYTITCDGTFDYLPIFGQKSGSANHYCTNIRISNNISSFSGNLFSYCYNLQNITMPNSVTSIGEYAFSYCYSLQNITIPNSVTSIEKYTFNYCYTLANAAIPNSVTSIGVATFVGCNLLQNVTIPNGVTIIINSSFNGCRALANITIPNSATSIGTNTFYDCNALVNITISNSVTSIGNGAFYGCSNNLKYSFLTNDSIPTLGGPAFAGINMICKIIVPDDLYDDWIVATNWSSYANFIYKASEVEE